MRNEEDIQEINKIRFFYNTVDRTRLDSSSTPQKHNLLTTTTIHRGNIQTQVEPLHLCK